MAEVINYPTSIQHDRVVLDPIFLQIKNKEDLFYYIDLKLGGWPTKTVLKALNDASVCAVMCFQRMLLPPEIQEMLIHSLRYGHELALKLKGLLERKEFFRKLLKEDIGLLDSACRAMHFVDMDDGVLIEGKLLQYVVAENDLADKAATRKKPKFNDVIQCFRAARWYARNDQYPAEKMPLAVWEYWSSFDPPVQAIIDSYFQKAVVRGSSLAMLKRVIKLPGWDLDESLHLCCVKNMKRHVEYLLTHGANANGPYGANANDPYGFATPLILSSSRGLKDIVELLIKYGADLNARDDGDTALIKAMDNGHEEIAQLLIEHGASLNTKDVFGETALHVAAIYMQKKIAKALIENGADLNAKNCDGLTALQISRKQGCKEIVDLLLEHGAKDEKHTEHNNHAVQAGWPF